MTRYRKKNNYIYRKILIKGGYKIWEVAFSTSSVNSALLFYFNFHFQYELKKTVLCNNIRY